MTVTKAASILGVGRPALSNLLNRKAALSREMALRLERAFGANREELLDLQSQFSRQEAVARPSVVTGTHAPEIAPIEAADIERWADGIRARQQLAGLVRRLVYSTGRDLTHVDFPAGDNAERPGWDGVVDTPTPTPWIPSGKSGWELSCQKDPRGKAEQVYDQRVRSVEAQDRQHTTFVFVTARNWKRKEEWVKEKAHLGEWKDVKVYDANVLEQWLEQSPPHASLVCRADRPASGWLPVA